jgi:CDP-diacylglycerol--inositol 3-phosphatidyltransferase
MTTDKNELDFSRAPNIILYVPNIMDYFRLIFLLIAFYYAKTSPIFFIVLYFISFALDAFDGKAARYLNQKSKLGATLDMVIDRVGTSGLLMVLSNFYVDYSHWFIFLMMLDIGSHWLQTHSGFMDANVKNDNHKNLEEKFWILNFYYKTTIGLFSVCLGAEVFLLLIYMVHFNKALMDNVIVQGLVYTTLPIYALKQFISIIQVVSASQRIAKFDQKEWLEDEQNKGK